MSEHDLSTLAARVRKEREAMAQSGLEPSVIMAGPFWRTWAGYRIEGLPVLVMPFDGLYLAAIPREQAGAQRAERLNLEGGPEAPEDIKALSVQARAGALYKAGYAAQVARQILSGITVDLEIHDLGPETEASKAVYGALDELTDLIKARAPIEIEGPEDEAQSLMVLSLMRLVSDLYHAYQAMAEQWPKITDPGLWPELRALLDFWERCQD